MDLLIWIVVIIIIVGGAVYFLRKKTGIGSKKNEGTLSNYTPPASPMNPPEDSAEDFSDDSSKNPPTDNI